MNLLLLSIVGHADTLHDANRGLVSSNNYILGGMSCKIQPQSLKK